jgi:hypothetical protein
MANPARVDDQEVVLALVADEVQGGSAPTRAQLIVELHAARNELVGLQALIAAQREHIAALQRELDTAGASVATSH